MGSGNWTSAAFTNKVRNMGFTCSADLGASRVQEVYNARMMDKLRVRAEKAYLKKLSLEAQADDKAREDNND